MFNYNKKITLYGKQSVLSLTFTIQNQGLQVAIAPAFDPNRQMGRPTPGQKVYNHDIASFFSLGMTECALLSRNFNDVLAGKYKDPDGKCDPKYTGWMKLTHFKDNQPTRLALYATPRDGKVTGTAMSISLSNPGKQNTSYVFKGEEVMILQGMLDFGWRIFPGICGTLVGLSSFFKSEQYQEKQKGTSGGGGGSSYSGSPPPAAAPGEDPWGGDAPATESVEDIKFEF